MTETPCIKYRTQRNCENIPYFSNAIVYLFRFVIKYQPDDDPLWSKHVSV